MQHFVATSRGNLIVGVGGNYFPISLSVGMSLRINVLNKVMHLIK